MKKNLTIWDQVAAAQKEVADWPDSIKMATEIQYAIFGSTENDEEELLSAAEKEEQTHVLHC